MLRLQTTTVPANGFAAMPFDGDYLRIKTAAIEFSFKTENGDDFTLIEGEEAFLEPFQILNIYNNTGAAQNVSYYIGKKGVRVGSAKVSGNVTVSNQIDILPATQTNLKVITNTVKVVNDGQAYGASYRSTTNTAANTPEAIFLPAANINGAILHSAQFDSYNGITAQKPALLAKASAPVSVTDGDGILSVDCHFSATGLITGSLKNPIKIPAGKGLYYISDVADTFASRSALYTLL
jgi:hypothetical protein